MSAERPDPTTSGTPVEASDASAAAVAPAASGGIRQLTSDAFSLDAAVGGWRGLIESIAPGLVFVVVFVARGSITPAVIAALGVALVAVVARLVARTSLTQALSGMVGVLIGVVWAWRSGAAENYYVWGLLTNAGFALGVLISILVRWPAVGLVVGALRQEGTAWRSEVHHLRRYTAASWLWFALFAARLVVQVPLYAQAEVGWLGTARLVMGVPLWALTLWGTWIIVREPGGAGARRAPRGTAQT